jgi:hypothetical protein
LFAVYNKETQLLAYAEDIVGRSQSVVRDAYLALDRETAKLRLNEQKSKYMIAAWNDRTIHDVGQSMAIGDKHFEVLKKFVDLGFLMTSTNDVSLEIQRRIQTASRCFFGLREHLQLSHLSHQTKFTIHKTLIRTVLFYGSQTWVLTKREENQLLIFDRNVLRTICGPKIENGVYRRRYNHKLDKEFDSPIAPNVTKTNRLRFAGHMIRKPEDLPQKALFEGFGSEWKDKSRNSDIQVGGCGEQ